MFGGGQTNSATIRAAAIIQDLFGPHFGGITGMNDNFHNEKARGSAHTKGTAFDFVTDQEPSEQDGKELMDLMRTTLKQAGIDVAYMQDEYNNPSPGATGGHFHIQVKEALAKGGITSGPSLAGEAGPEAVIPLPDGRTIPVKMDFSELVEKFEEMIQVMKDHRDTSEKILWSNS